MIGWFYSHSFSVTRVGSHSRKELGTIPKVRSLRNQAGLPTLLLFQANQHLTTKYAGTYPYLICVGKITWVWVKEVGSVDVWTMTWPWVKEVGSVPCPLLVSWICFSSPVLPDPVPLGPPAVAIRYLPEEDINQCQYSWISQIPVLYMTWQLIVYLPKQILHTFFANEPGF